ncbi:MAG TPA: MBOAT family O-acyltransferase [Bryobacteraceae bacterium]|nr:MBOAT family O-acyltransferase [Bryobacteraceae bacterium]
MFPTTPPYYYLLVTVFFAFWLVRRERLGTLILICAANLFFYSRSGLIYLALIPAAAGIDYLLGGAIARTEQPNLRRLLVTCSIAMNVGLIVTTKFVLSLSLSFYAFQALTYTLDIYRGDAKPAPGFGEYLASVTFFPTILAGPITRVSSLVPQWKWKGTVLSGEEGGRALFLIGLGLFKKFLIADYLANNLINRVFDLPTLYSSGDVLAAVYAYAFQLYYDFSGYSDIALGAGLLLGIRLPINFNAPYTAANISDFWRRWHISFSNWLRDYLFFSLPGKRTKAMPYLNLVITMAIGGLWHGISWNFLIWGLLHGIGQAVFRLWQTMKQPMWRWAACLLTFHFVLFAWIFFRAATFETAMQILGQIAALRPATATFGNVSPAFLFVLLAGIAGHFIPKSWSDTSVVWFSKAPAVVQAAALAGLLLSIRLVASSGAAPFIYSRF